MIWIYQPEKHKVDEFEVMNKIEKNENKLDLIDSLESKIYKGETHFIEFKQSLSWILEKLKIKLFTQEKKI